MLPYGYASGEKPDDFNELVRSKQTLFFKTGPFLFFFCFFLFFFNIKLRVGKLGTKALMAVNNQRWGCGNIVDELYAAPGNSVDWFKSVGVKYTFVLELRGDGFVVPESEIDPSGREVFAGITTAVKAMKHPTTPSVA